MSQYYQVEGAAGASPLLLADMKEFLKIPAALVADDVLLQTLIDSATEVLEKYTGRSFRTISYRLFIDEFEDRIVLHKDPVTSITSIEHLVADVLTAVPSTTYYLKKHPQFSEILRVSSESWPTNTDDREQAVQIVFLTSAYPCGNAILEALKRYVSYTYSNRGDCDCDDATVIIENSGAGGILNYIRIARI